MNLNALKAATAVLGLVSVASAQTGAQKPNMTPEMRARLAQMQPILDLAQDIRLLPDLEKNAATAMTKAQAKQLLPLLAGLQKARAVQPGDAKQDLAQIEDKILTDGQLTALDDLQLKAQRERAARRAQAPAGGQGNRARVPGFAGLFGGLGAQRPGGQGGAGQGAQNQNGQPGPFNPFKQGRGADALKAYIAVLQKK